VQIKGKKRPKILSYYNSVLKINTSVTVINLNSPFFQDIEASLDNYCQLSSDVVHIPPLPKNTALNCTVVEA